ncbi:hypothetical protein SAMN04487787_108128 [Kosakonia sacchari]|nr:hypothetical protein SAMN04487787_108128 [Kosakonia sacchari]
MKNSPQQDKSAIKELVRAGHEFAAAMGNDTPIIEIAKLVSRLATELDVQSTIVRQLTASAAITDIIAERQRQQSVEGWTPEHDDQHVNFEMAIAGGLYAITAIDSHPQLHNTAPAAWPWDRNWWKPTNPRRDLVKAGALIAAEIERIDRAASKFGEVQS